MPRSSPLDGIRALAALSVVFFHVWVYRAADPPGPRTTFVDKALFEASLGLICFFVLSGFLLYRQFARAALTGGEPVSLGRYALRRAARIMPAYYVNLLGCLLLFWAVGYSDIVPPAHHLPAFALFAQNYSRDTVMQINPVTWTLSVEAAFYVVLPLLGLAALVLGPARPRLQACVLVALIGSTVAWNAAVNDAGAGALASKMLPTYLGHFAIGMLVALWVEWRAVRARRAFTPASTAGLMALGLSLVLANAYWHETAGSFGTAWKLCANLPAAMGFALVIAAAAAGRGRAVAWLAVRPLVGLGIVSYGVYLWHLPVILAVREAGLLPAAFVPRLAFVLPLVVGAAYLSWVLVERPVLRLASGRERRHSHDRAMRRAVFVGSP
jgi:peptidoglycan/LPS O-acetylase OafA/YrhL